MKYLLILLLLLLPCLATAQEEEGGVEIHPYTAFTVDRPSGPDEWSTGWLFGVEATTDPIFLKVSYQLHDILTKDELYEWDATFQIVAGVATAYTFLGVTGSPYGAFALSRPTDPGNWSVGLHFGYEADFDPLFVDARYQLHDVWSETKVYDWSGGMRLAAGAYF